MTTEASQDFRRCDLACYPRLGDMLNVLDRLATYLHRDGFMPLVRAHAHAAIPLRRGSDIIRSLLGIEPRSMTVSSVVAPRPQFAWPASTAAARWSTLGPYYAMFPISFARAVVETLCPAGGGVLDPFCGRGTVPYVARVTGRLSLGIDLNAVAYVFSAVKTDPAPRMEPVLARFTELVEAVRPSETVAANDFQRLAWSPRVLGYLNAARRVLDWRDNRLDRTVMAFLLVHLHGKTGNAVSNQMRQSKSMAPEYSVRWWSSRGLTPPDLDPVRYFTHRAAWRYRHGVPMGTKARIVHGDALEILPRARRRFAMLFTSPPYYDVTNYRLDNWIRLWMLGEGELPNYTTAQRYGDRKRYAEMLRGVFNAAKRTLEDDAIIYCSDGQPTFHPPDHKSAAVRIVAISRAVHPTRAARAFADQPLRSKERETRRNRLSPTPPWAHSAARLCTYGTDHSSRPCRLLPASSLIAVRLWATSSSNAAIRLDIRIYPAQLRAPAPRHCIVGITYSTLARIRRAPAVIVGASFRTAPSGAVGGA